MAREDGAGCSTLILSSCCLVTVSVNVLGFFLRVLWLVCGVIAVFLDHILTLVFLGNYVAGIIKQKIQIYVQFY